MNAQDQIVDCEHVRGQALVRLQTVVLTTSQTCCLQVRLWRLLRRGRHRQHLRSCPRTA